MKRQIALSLALTSLMTANAVFAAPAILTPAAQPQIIAQDGSDRTIDRLHKQMGEEVRVADNGTERTIDRLHKQMSEEARVAANGSEHTIDRLHQEMNQARVAENGSEHSVDRLHGNMVAESGGDIVFDAHLKA
ncbi:phage infection protein [Pseudomonas sp. MT3]|nr:phage infection protein [uncultured Pseudomonas sp.]